MAQESSDCLQEAEAELMANIYHLQVLVMADNCSASSCSSGRIYQVPSSRSSVCGHRYHTGSNHYQRNCRKAPSDWKRRVLVVNNNYFYRSHIGPLGYHICDDRVPNNLCLFDDDNLMVGMVRMDRVCVVLWGDNVFLSVFDHRNCRVGNNDLVECDVNDMCSLKKKIERLIIHIYI